MLVRPGGTPATLLNNFKNGVHAYKTVRENRSAMIIRIARQLVLVDPSPAIYCITILIDRVIEDHGSADLGAIGSGGRYTADVSVLKSDTRHVACSSRSDG